MSSGPRDSAQGGGIQMPVGLSATREVVGVGIDLVDVGRLGRALARTPGLAARLFTPVERAYCEAASSHDLRVQRFAARFAAKEAAMKAMGVGLGAFGWHDLEIDRGASGQPELAVRGRAADLAEARGGARWLVSISHVGPCAAAIAVLLR